MDYSELISRSFHIVWKNKVLWLLGFLAGLAANGMRYNGNISSSMGEMSPEQIAAIGAMAVFASCVLFILAIVLWVLATIARGGLIRSVWLLDEDETVSLTVTQALEPGKKAFWRMIGVSILLYLPVWIFSTLLLVMIFVMVGGTAVFASTLSDPESMMAGLGFFFICFFAFICLMIPVGLFIQLIQAFAVRGTVIRDLGVTESIQHGWDVLRGNIGEILLLGILFTGIGMAFGFAVAIVILPISLLAMAPVMGVMFTGGDVGALAGVWMLFAGIGIAILSAMLLSVFTAWRSAAFTLAYKQFTGKEPKNMFEPDFGMDDGDSFEPKWSEA